MSRKYSDQFLVFEITKRCAIWDSSSREFYDEELKQAAWREVVEVFARPGDSLQQKKNLELYLRQRWIHTRRKTSIEVKQIIAVCKGFLENASGSYRQTLQNLILALKSCDEFDEDAVGLDGVPGHLRPLADSDADTVKLSSSDSSDSELVNELSKSLRNMLLQKSPPEDQNTAAGNETSQNNAKENKPNPQTQESKKQKQQKQEPNQQGAPPQPQQPPQPRGGGAGPRRGRRGQSNAQRGHQSYSNKASRSLL